MIVSYFEKKTHWATLMIYMTYPKNLPSKIKFTMEHSFKEQPFLDILIKKQNGQIKT